MIRRFLMSVIVLAVICATATAQVLNAKPASNAPSTRSAPLRAWDDLRWLMTALEAYGTDNDSLYGPADGVREGVVSDLDRQLEWYYANTFPRRQSPPHLDPWERPYHFVISSSRKSYALYSLGVGGQLDDDAKAVLDSVKNDRVGENELGKRRTSPNVIVISGKLLFAPEDVLATMKPAP